MFIGLCENSVKLYVNDTHIDTCITIVDDDVMKACTSIF